MNDSSWDKLTDSIDIKFGLTKHGREERQLEDRLDLKATVQYVEFTREGQSYRLERIGSPAITDRKSIGAHRAGSGIRFENIYDPTEISYKVSLLSQVGDSWQPVDLTQLDI